MTSDIKLPGEEDTTFYLDIERHMTTSNVSVMEACIEWCSKRNIEIEYVATLIANNPKLKSKLQCEAEELNFIKKSQRKPI